MALFRVSLVLALLALADAGAQSPLVAAQPPDTIPPVITSGPTLAWVAFTDASVVWTTDEPSGGRLELAASPDEPQPLVVHFESVFLASWEVTHFTLLPHTTYYVRVILRDQYANGPTISPWVSFKTLGDDVPPADVAPTADAGPDQAVSYGQLVTLDGSGSFDDNTPTPLLRFAWTHFAKPDGSLAVLSYPNSMKPTFIADVPGAYGVSLTVIDSAQQFSAPDRVNISSVNLPPGADAGDESSGYVGGVVTFNGSGSVDPEGGGLTYAWELASKPAGSAASLRDMQSVTPSLIPDVTGEYRVRLVVRDQLGLVSAPASTVAVIVTPGEYTASLVVLSQQLLNALPRGSGVINEGHRTALSRLLTDALRASDRGDLTSTRRDLAAAIERVDGCAVRGAPDGAGPGLDWIVGCAEQLPIYHLLASAVAVLQ
jgi:hypothetical protein